MSFRYRCILLWCIITFDTDKNILIRPRSYKYIDTLYYSLSYYVHNVYMWSLSCWKFVTWGASLYNWSCISLAVWRKDYRFTEHIQGSDAGWPSTRKIMLLNHVRPMFPRALHCPDKIFPCQCCRPTSLCACNCRIKGNVFRTQCHWSK